MTRSIVTGASGFIGRALCQELLAQGGEVVALCRHLPAALVPGVEAVACDLTDRVALRHALEQARADWLFHLAGFTRATRELEAVTIAFDANVTPTVNVLSAAAHVGFKRIVLAGSQEESDLRLTPTSPYAASKMTATLYARMFHQLYQTPVTTARIFMAYGPGQRAVHKIVPHTILTLLRGDDLEFTSARRRLDWVYIDDVARGLVAVAARPDLAGETIDLGTGRLTSLREVIDHLVTLVAPHAKPRFGVLPDRPDEQEPVADTARTEHLLGWHARVPLEDGLLRTARYYAQFAGTGLFPRPASPLPVSLSSTP